MSKIEAEIRRLASGGDVAEGLEKIMEGLEVRVNAKSTGDAAETTRGRVEVVRRTNKDHH